MRAPAPQPPSLGGFELLEVLGTGGTSRVHRARHLLTGKVVAIKILDPTNGDPSAYGRFLREARTTAMIRHPNVVDVLDVGESPDGNPFMVMELVDGEDLQMLLERRGSLSWDEAKLYLRQVCDGLAAAHDAGVVHRDLKLSNCIVVEHNGRPTVKVVDFGLAKPTGEALKRLTAMGTVIGTPEYMSPEQCSGEGEVDHRTDVYAVGVMAYELLTGAPPYTDSNFMRLLLKHMEQPVPSPSGRNPKLSRGVDALLLRALAKNKEDRIPTMREFAEEIEMAHTTAYAKIHYRKAIAGAVVKLRCSSSDATDLDAVVTNPRVEPITNARTRVSGVGLVEASMSGVRTLISKVGALTEPNRVVTRRHGERSSSGVSASEPVTLRSEVLEADDVRTMVHVEQRRNRTWIVGALACSILAVLGALLWVMR